MGIDDAPIAGEGTLERADGGGQFTSRLVWGLPGGRPGDVGVKAGPQARRDRRP